MDLRAELKICLDNVHNKLVSPANKDREFDAGKWQGIAEVLALENKYKNLFIPKEDDESDR